MEIGVAITPQILENIERTEVSIRELHSCPVVRCRYRKSGIVVEMANTFLKSLSEAEKESITLLVAANFGSTNVRFEEYRMGSASWNAH